MEERIFTADMPENELAMERTEMALERTRLAMDRSRLANTQTLLAFLRTALGLFTAGIGMYKLLDNIAILRLGVAFMIAAPVLMVIGIVQYCVVSRRWHRVNRTLTHHGEQQK